LTTKTYVASVFGEIQAETKIYDISLHMSDIKVILLQQTWLLSALYHTCTLLSETQRTQLVKGVTTSNNTSVMDNLLQSDCLPVLHDTKWLCH